MPFCCFSLLFAAFCVCLAFLTPSPAGSRAHVTGREEEGSVQLDDDIVGSIEVFFFTRLQTSIHCTLPPVCVSLPPPPCATSAMMAALKIHFIDRNLHAP